MKNLCFDDAVPKGWDGATQLRRGACRLLTTVVLILGLCCGVAEDAEADPALVIQHVSVIDVAAGRAASNRTVLIRDSRITAVSAGNGAGRATKDAIVIDGRGKFLMPGLVDMHAHLNARIEAQDIAPTLALSDSDILSENNLVLFLVNGITTLQVMHGDQGMLAMRDDIAQGKAIGPRLVVGSPRLDGNPPSSAFPRIVATAEEGTAVVDEMHASGYDFIKVYDGLDKATYDAIVDRAHSYGLRVDGHLPRHLPLEYGITGRQDHVAHMEEFVNYANQFNDDEIRRLTQAAKRSGIGVTPTLTVFKNAIRSIVDIDGLLNDPQTVFADPIAYVSWQPSRNPYQSEKFQSTQIRQWMTDALRFMEKLTLSFDQAGVPLVVGTDCNYAGTVAGFSYLDELIEMQAIGINRADILRMATINAAVALRLDKQLGTISPGKLADLVLLDGNPLDALANTRRITGLVLQGRWLPRSELRKMLSDSMAKFAVLDRRLQLHVRRPDLAALE